MIELRIKALMLLYKSVEKRLTMTLPDFILLLDSWDVIPLSQDNKIIGAVIIKGPELHVGYGVAPKASVLKHIKIALIPVLNKYGFALTIVKETNLTGLKFCKRLGFKIVSQDLNGIHMKCEKCNYV